MCGIVGFVEARADVAADELRARVVAMADTLRHRGPDAGGAWVDAATGVALGHRRLSILDLSEQGAQPMRSSCGRIVLAYNGEIYNHPELRRELRDLGRQFRGRSDTEVLVEALATWGTEATLPRLLGMFAFAAWDTHRHRLLLARDPIGKKSLYYGWVGRRFVFASELKALRALPGLGLTVDPDVVALFLRFAFVPSPYCIFKNLRRLEPGTAIEVDPDAVGGAPRRLAFWSMADAAVRGERMPFEGTPEDAVDAVEALLSDAVRRRMVADVPLGALLSGGVDSSVVVALMQRSSTRPVQTFTIGFEEPGYDEAEDAAAVARHLGTEHHTLVVTPDDARAVIPDLPAIFDEPFADPSAVPTVVVCRLARRGVIVALSGDGGDELLAGYNSYPRTLRRWRMVSRLPRPLRRMLADGLSALGRAARSEIGGGPPPAGVSAWRRLAVSLSGEAAVLTARDPVEALVTRAERFADPLVLAPDASPLPTHFSDVDGRPQLTEPVHRLMYLDAMTFLAEDVLVKVDRASMAAGLEVRNPILDRRVVELAWSLPVRLKIRGGVGKWVLREVLGRSVPRSLWNRPKRGFSVPIAEWTRGPLRGWVEDLLSEAHLRRHGLLDPQAARRAWQWHLAGWGRQHHRVWTLVMLEAWLDAWT